MSARMITLTGGVDGKRLAINADAVSQVQEVVHGAGAEIVMVTGARMFVVETFDQVLDKMRGDQPTERKRGRWINRSLSVIYPAWERYTCSVCGKHSDRYDFCPNCGANMEGEA